VAASAPARAAGRPRGPGEFRRGVAAGAGLALSNPQAVLFYVAILPGVVDQHRGPSQYAAYAAALVIVMTAVAAAYIGLGARARSAATGPRATRNADRIAGTMLVGAGCFVAAR
jgi:threonine/homoserine/homoserine lactone efflux protein